MYTSYYTVSPSLLEYLYPQGLMGVHTGASRNCGSQSFPSCTHSTRYVYDTEYMLFLLAKQMARYTVATGYQVIHLSRGHGPSSDLSALIRASFPRFRFLSVAVDPLRS